MFSSLLITSIEQLFLADVQRDRISGGPITWKMLAAFPATDLPGEGVDGAAADPARPGGRRYSTLKPRKAIRAMTERELWQRGTRVKVRARSDSANLCGGVVWRCRP